MAYKSIVKSVTRGPGAPTRPQQRLIGSRQLRRNQPRARALPPRFFAARRPSGARFLSGTSDGVMASSASSAREAYAAAGLDPARDVRFRFSVDRGGTFTDLYCEIVRNAAGGSGAGAPSTDGGSAEVVRVRVCKLLSVDPAYPDPVVEGVRRVLEEETGQKLPRGAPVPWGQVEFIRMGTTVATNALLERQGEPLALIVTRGFKDLLHIGNQSRPHIFDLRIEVPEVLYKHVIEVDERVVPASDVWEYPSTDASEGVVVGSTGEEFMVLQRPDMAELEAQLRGVYDAGIRSVAVLLMHSYAFSEHEIAVGNLCREIGFTQISLSSQVMPTVKAVARGFTACADAYLTPHIRRSVEGFVGGFEPGLTRDVGRVSFMKSDGGLTPVDKFTGHKGILSGPAGGVVGFSATAWDPVKRQPLIGFDMGGTSTDVSRFAGRLEHVQETTTAGITIQAPQCDINTVAAGGGSLLKAESGMFMVGPQSAGAHPGPVCYRKGGKLAITDANVVLGRVQPDYFPKIFGETEDQPLDAETARAAFEDLREQMRDDPAFASAGGADQTVDEIAYGFLRVGNEAMCRPIRALTQMRGYDVAKHVLACFGGAGGQHACAIAKSLGMRTVFIHRYSGILSAYGMGLADVVEERQEPANQVHGASTAPGMAERLCALATDATVALEEQGFARDKISVELFLNLRYQGTDSAVMTRCGDLLPSKDMATARIEEGEGESEVPVAVAAERAAESFVQQYEREFGFTLPDRDILVDDIRVRGIAHGTSVSRTPIEKATSAAVPERDVSVYFAEGGRQATPLFLLANLKAGHEIEGPAIIIDNTSTIVVEPRCTAVVTDAGDVRIDVEASSAVAAVADADGAEVALGAAGDSVIAEQPVDPILLGVFSHRFMSIAEQMGRTLQRTSISVNIKERLDFSCALFGPDGGLVANAPHIPVHLGAMQDAVRYQMKHWGDDVRDGDVWVSNHPQLAGGSHLPDITVITPVFAGTPPRIVFFVASRGHHADIGGIAPGSMPALSRTLAEEGAAIVGFKLVKGGVFQEEGITELLMAPGKNGIPGSVGTRNLKDNLSDLRAQVAANHAGIGLVRGLIEEYSLPVVHSYMRFIQENAESAVRDMLCDFSLRRGLPEVGSVVAEDRMDDGNPIKLRVTIDRRTRSAEFDFTGTGPEAFANTNAPPAVTYSAVIYSLRCMVDKDIPLNQGCLAPVTIKLPEGCLLHPSPTAGVVGGNVLTSQRVVDVVLRAFGAAAASQGCTNNLTFGDDVFGYYETIAGGAGAGPGWHGRSGVHTHMTNTRITDPEIFERRYPVVLRRFALREGSGGDGAFRGGDGVIREVEFRKQLRVSILSERRSLAPFGLAGGGEGERGVNLLTRSGGHKVSLGGKNTVDAMPGDSLAVMTPGGGGYGAVDADADALIDGAAVAIAGPSTEGSVPSGSLENYRRSQESA